MKLSWGKGIWAFYGLFVAMILTMVGMSVVQKIDLVTDSYYEEELRFQGKIDKIKQAQKLTIPLTWEVTDHNILVKYPKNLNNISGHINFYCPSDNRKDFKLPIQIDAQSSQSIPLEKISAGRYQIQFDWQAAGTQYWNEGIINL
ncbi:FixH family protein [Runella sp. MFBS21]|uniref:FixH family protein n=1 Tax=Runella sp. MFBS21 TaxID=3034018 RepID=UPI0023F9AC1E|nr:FixH family protein [Runella sp. MFBS21]MDF7818787.1 FixH family protein [Runella sp. MFBS21]